MPHTFTRVFIVRLRQVIMAHCLAIMIFLSLPASAAQAINCCPGGEPNWVKMQFQPDRELCSDPVRNYQRVILIRDPNRMQYAGINRHFSLIERKIGEQEERSDFVRGITTPKDGSASFRVGAAEADAGWSDEVVTAWEVQDQQNPVSVEVKCGPPE